MNNTNATKTADELRYSGMIAVPVPLVAPIRLLVKKYSSCSYSGGTICWYIKPVEQR